MFKLTAIQYFLMGLVVIVIGFMIYKRKLKEKEEVNEKYDISPMTTYSKNYEKEDEKMEEDKNYIIIIKDTECNEEEYGGLTEKRANEIYTKIKEALETGKQYVEIHSIGDEDNYAELITLKNVLNARISAEE